jgi:hypothetical protein
MVYPGYLPKNDNDETIYKGWLFKAVHGQWQAIRKVS